MEVVVNKSLTAFFGLVGHETTEGHSLKVSEPASVLFVRVLSQHLRFQ